MEWPWEIWVWEAWEWEVWELGIWVDLGDEEEWSLKAHEVEWVAATVVEVCPLLFWCCDRLLTAFDFRHANGW